MKLCSPSGTRPVKSAANQAAIQARKVTTPQSESQMMAGITRSARKKTVSRLRCRSSVTTSRIGCSCSAVAVTVSTASYCSGGGASVGSMRRS